MTAFPAIRIVAVGRIGRGPEADLLARYCQRIRPAPVLVEVPDARGTPAEARRREASALLGAIPREALIVPLDQGGQALDSAGLARLLERAERPVCFVIGGATGLDASVVERGSALSLGAMTWPHLLARAMLAEQLYRAFSIVSGHPYHRAERP